ncbi:MAG: hypothetical protein ACI89X_000847 [Planctomycetota bacterium]|jgi:hypothetical protein
MKLAFGDQIERVGLTRLDVEWLDDMFALMAPCVQDEF